MNDVRVRPVRESGRVVGFAVDVRKDGAFENVGWFSSWDRAHTFAHRRAAKRILDRTEWGRMFDTTTLSHEGLCEHARHAVYRDLGLNFRWV